MKRLKILIAGLFVGLLQFSLLTPFSAKAETVAGNYTINVNTPGTFAQVLLQTVDNWSDVVELTISGHLNASDMAYFSRLQKLRKLDLSQTDIKSIGGCSDLSLLKEVDLPKSVTKIEENAFYGCSALVTIDLNNIEEIGKLAFGRCGFKGSIFGPKVKFIGVQAFGGCNYIESISFPVAEEIQHDGFSYMSRLTTVDIPNVKTLGYEVFEYCKSLSNVKLSDDLEDIPDRCFQSTALKSIVLPSNLNTIGDRAFFGSNISSIELPEGLKDIKSGAFERCLIETIILPSTLESIGSAAFSSDGGALTGPAELKDVYCKCVVPLLTTTFRKDWVKDATLHVPACSLLSYKLHENWNRFNKIVALTEDVNNITVNNDFSFIVNVPLSALTES